MPLTAEGDGDLVAVGRIVTTHGLRGEVRVHLFNPDSTTLRAGSEIVLQRGGEQSLHRIQAARPHKRVVLVTLEGCESIAIARTLVGSEVCVVKSQLPPAGPGEAYHFELLGMRVVTTRGEDLGMIVEILSLASNDVCVVRRGEHEHLIPMIADVVKEIDRQHCRLVIEPLPGLLD